MINRRMPQYFYIRQHTTGNLLHGVAVGDGHDTAPFVIWKGPRNFNLARRFTTVGNAIKFSRMYGVGCFDVIDRAGQVQYTHSDESKVRKDA